MADQNASRPMFTWGRSKRLGGLLAQAQDGSGRSRFAPTLRGVIFSMMMLVAVVPIVGFYTWVERNSYLRELNAVHDSHLLIAKNLSSALSRYAKDAKSVFALAVSNMQDADMTDEFGLALSKFHICHIVILDADGQEVSRMNGDNDHPGELPTPSLLKELVQTARAADGEIVISGIRHHHDEPHFFILQALAGGQVAVAPLSPAYVVELQKSIAFGERGHSMMVDQDGLVVAHPNAEWQRISKDAKKLSVVQAMIGGGTGVMQFYSPPMQADMIAGYTFVPETGWGVMVPQPLSELADKANESRTAAIAIAVMQFSLAVLISLWLSSWLTKPIRKISEGSTRLAQGDLDSRVGELPDMTPYEIVRTAEAFDAMGDGIKMMTVRLKDALQEAERVSGERARLLEAAERASEVKSQFVSMVSHELRTPLTSIKGSLELMNVQAKGQLAPEVATLLEIAIRNGRRLAVLIDDLLDLEQLDAHKLNFSFEQIEMGDLVQEAVTTHAGYATLAGVHLHFTPPETALKVEADYSRLMQVMANLLSNASKFSQSGDDVYVSFSTEQGKAVIRVEDHGMGIPEGTGDSIFEAFTQLDSSDRRVVGGSGLGLNISRTIVERHKGTLTYESVLGEGTTFIVTLPLEQS